MDTRTMPSATHYDIKKLLIEYFKQVDFKNPYAVTFTMIHKQWRDFNQNFRHFLNRLNQRIYGKSCRRYGNKITVIPIIEGTTTIRPHYHAVIDNPLIDREAEFRQNVIECWSKTELALPQLHLTQMTDEGWIDYIMKLRTKRNIFDSIDWDNVVI